MTATAMNDFLQQLHDLVPTFNVASIPRDATGVYASPVHIIAELLNVTPSYIQKIINNICANVNVNCTKMKVIVNGTEQRNTIMVGNAESIMRVLASCTRQDIATIVARLPIVVPVPQAPVVAPVRPPTSVALGSQALVDEMDVNSNQDNILQDDDAMIIKHTFVPEPTQMVDFVLKLADGSDFIVPVRRDGYVNVTKICQAAGNSKCMKEWKTLQSSKESRKYLQKMLDEEYAENVKLGKAIGGKAPIALLTSCKGGNINTVEQGTYAHPDLAIIIAAWASKSFQFQVSRWIRELMITAPSVAPVHRAPSVAPALKAPAIAINVDGALADDSQNNDDMTIQDHFDFVPAQMVEFVLELNGSKFNIPVRRDGYVNVTKICQAAGNGKRLDNYRASPAGKEYMEFLKNRNLAKSNSRNPAITLLTSIRGNCPGRGTYAHPDLAMAIAMWAHPPFLAEVSGWIRELLITGKVELGKEKSPEKVNENLP